MALRRRRTVRLSNLRPRERARLLIDFVPGLRAGLEHWLPKPKASEICDSLAAQLRIAAGVRPRRKR